MKGGTPLGRDRGSAEKLTAIGTSIAKEAGAEEKPQTCGYKKPQARKGATKKKRRRRRPKEEDEAGRGGGEKEKQDARRRGFFFSMEKMALLRGNR